MSRVLILAQSLLSRIGIVLVLRRTFQENAVLAGDLKDIPVHFTFERDPLRLLEVIRFFEMVDHSGLVAKGIADMEAYKIGVLCRIVLDGLSVVEMRDDRNGLAGFLPGRGDRFKGGEITREADQYRDRYGNEDQYDDV